MVLWGVLLSGLCDVGFSVGEGVCQASTVLYLSSQDSVQTTLAIPSLRVRRKLAFPAGHGTKISSKATSAQEEYPNEDSNEVTLRHVI